MKLSSTKVALFLSTINASAIVICSGKEDLVVRALKGEGYGRGKGKGQGTNNEDKSKMKVHTKAKSKKSTTDDIAPTMLVKCKSSKGKKSKGDKSKSIGLPHGWCPFIPELNDTFNVKSKKKSKVNEDNTGKSFSFLDGILGYEPKTKVHVFPSTDMMRCLQLTADGDDLVFDTCRFDEDSVFTIDRYGRLHTAQGWGQCVAADAAGTDITPGPCYDCSAIFSYDADLSLIRLYEDPTTVISFRGTDVFLAEEIIEPTCISNEPILGKVDDEPIEQSMVMVPIEMFELPTTSPAPSSSMPPALQGSMLPVSEDRLFQFGRTASTTMPKTSDPASSPITSSPTTPAFSPTVAPTSTPEEIHDYTIAAAATLYMLDPLQGRTQFGDIADWNTSKITSAYGIFDKTLSIHAKSFNADIGSWDTSGIYITSYLFNGAEAFDQYIGDWDTSSLLYAQQMFQDAISFNQDIQYWDTTSVMNFYGMFKGASGFNQDLTLWNLDSAEYVEMMFWDSGLKINQCFDLKGKGLTGSCEIFKGSAGGDDLFCDYYLCQ